MNRIHPFILITVLTWTLAACGPGNGPAGRSAAAGSSPPLITDLEEPESSISIPVGSEIPVRLTYPDTVAVDSIQVFLGGAWKRTLPGGTRSSGPGEPAKALETVISTEGGAPGRTGLRLRIFFSGGGSENQSRPVTLLSDIEPTSFTYRVLHTYHHSEEAYTQGLVYANGWLYEGTGNYGTSSIRKVELETGEVVMQRDLEQKFFGEGITVFGGLIYQLTYKSQVGFVYHMETFEEVRKIYYQNREGWGLTHNGEELVMSDGTHVIYFLDPGLFTVTRQIEVYDHRGPVNNLNELEFIRGMIWANRYYTDEIVIIDPATGKVEGRANLKGILNATDRKPTTDVLNGIAWDREGDRVFVTGKFWPKLFEIKLTAPRK